MSTNTKNNINLNKLNEDEKNTQVATGQKIARPSDDPVIAIRALRFNTTLSQLNQYHDKNIPDATAWLKTTETALSQTDAMYDSILQDLTTGSSDTNTETDRQKILANLKGIRDEFYATGNADYAGRTVFTGYRTGESLTFLATDTDLKDTYRITQNITSDDLREMTYVKGSPNGVETEVKSFGVTYVRLAYDNCDPDGQAPTFNIYKMDPETGIKTKVDQLDNISVQSIAGMNQNQIDEVYARYDNSQHGPYGCYIPETGELLLCPCGINEIEALEKNGYFLEVEYNKSNWESGDLRPEHYFACEKTPNGGTEADKVQYNFTEEINKKTGEPTGRTIQNFEDQDIEVEVSFNQKVTINTHASDVYSHDIGRDIDYLLVATQDVVDCDEKLKKLDEKLAKATTEEDKKAIQKEIDAVKKEWSLKKDKMQKLFSKGLDTFQDYADYNNKAIADIGSMVSRLNITKERVSDQLMSFTELADENININLTDAAIDLSNANLALQAAQLAASKIAQQTLLNYL